MQDALPEAGATPDRLYDLFIGHWKTGIIKAAVELDVFSGVAAGDTTVPTLAASRNVKERGMRALLDGLCGLRLLNKAGERYALTPEADRFLVKGRPAYLGGALKAFVHPDDWEAMGRIEEAIQQGGPLKTGERDPVFWQEVARGLIPLGLMVGRFMCDILAIRPGTHHGFRVLDIACGSGVYGYSILERDQSAFGTAFDLHDVLPAARETAAAMGVADRVTFQAGDIERPAFNQEAYDIAIISNILQGYDPGMIESILGHVHGALVPGGRVVIHEFVPDEERARKSLPLLFAVYMYVVTPGGGTYTFSEFSRWLRNAGFNDISLHDLPTQTSIILASK